MSILRASGCSATTDEETIATKNMTAADLDIVGDNFVFDRIYDDDYRIWHDGRKLYSDDDRKDYTTAVV